MSDIITKGAAEIASSLKSTAGSIKLSRVVKVHLDWFDWVEEVGLTWTQICGLLAKSGAVRPDGKPFSTGSLSSAVWRARKAAMRQQPRQASASTPQHLQKAIKDFDPNSSTLALASDDSAAIFSGLIGKTKIKASDRNDLRQRIDEAVRARNSH